MDEYHVVRGLADTQIVDNTTGNSTDYDSPSLEHNRKEFF